MWSAHCWVLNLGPPTKQYRPTEQLMSVPSCHQIQSKALQIFRRVTACYYNTFSGHCQKIQTLECTVLQSYVIAQCHAIQGCPRQGVQSNSFQPSWTQALCPPLKVCIILFVGNYAVAALTVCSGKALVSEVFWVYKGIYLIKCNLFSLK